MYSVIFRGILLLLGGVLFTITPAFAFDFNVNGGVKNVHLPDGSYATYLDIEVDTGDPSSPADFSTAIFSGPSGQIATYDIAHDTTDSESLDVMIDKYPNGHVIYLWLIIPGQPELGSYSITVTSSADNGSVVKTMTDTQTVIREIPLPDENQFSPQDGATLASKAPEFSWSLLPYNAVPLYYRFEIYDSSDTQIHNSARTLNMSSYVPPPGVLQPGELYKWRVRVTDSAQWISVENRSHSDWQTFTMESILGPKPVLDLDNSGVRTFTTSNGMGFSTWVKVIDHGGVDSKCHVVTVQPPVGGPQQIEYLYNNGSDEAFFESWTNADSDPANYAGDWTFTVQDCVGNSATLIDNLTVAPLPLPDESTFLPADGTTLVDTTPTFSWSLQSGANADKVKRYRVRIYNADLTQTVWTGWVGTEASYTVPPGVLAAGTNYRYRIDTYDSHSSFETDNSSRAPANSADYFSFTTGTESPDPYIDLDNTGVHTWNREFWGPSLSFWIKVFDPQGVPDNIKSVTAVLPGPEEIEIPLRLDNNDSNISGFYTSSIFPTSITPGTYTFKVVDNQGNTFETTEVFTNNPISYPTETSLLPLRSTLLGTTAVDFDWEDIAGAAFYRVEIYDEYFNRINSLATTASNLSVPEGFLEEGKYYSYRITARREFFEENVDNGSNSPQYGDNRFNFIKIGRAHV